jgi:uncharacterized protein (DUF885 family)
MMRIKHLAMFFLSAALIASGCFFEPSAQAQQARRAPSESSLIEVPSQDDLNVPRSEMQDLITRYPLDRHSVSRTVSHEMSASRQARMKEFYQAWLASLSRLNFDGLSQAGKVDYILFRNYLEYELRQLELQIKSYAEIASYLPFAPTILALDEARHRMELADGAKAATTLHNLSKEIEAARRIIEAGLRTQGRAEGDAKSRSVKRALANRAVTALNNLRSTLRTWHSFYNGYDPLFTWWTEEPYQQADQTLQGYISFLNERVVGAKADAGSTPAPVAMGGNQAGAGPGRGGGGGNPLAGTAGAQAGSSDDIVGNPIGREGIMADLAREMIPYTPEELIALANKEFEWCESEMKKASRALGYGEDWHKALEYVKTLHVEPGKQTQLVKELALEAIKFIDDHDLMTVPQLARQDWQMLMMSPQRQLVNPFFTGGDNITVSFPTNTMSHEAKMMSMRGNNIHFSRATVHHELIPGHHLQGYMGARYRPYRQLFGTPFWGEGWALYWEFLLWDLNFPKTPENRIGMLFWRMHRCARIIFSLSFHLEKMTPQECIDLLVNRVGHERYNAEAEVRRSFAGNYSPLYQAAYMLGGLQIYSLHKELVGSGKMTNRAFHDAMLREGSIPIEMMRAELIKQPLTRDYKSSWKFYGPNPGAR